MPAKPRSAAQKPTRKTGQKTGRKMGTLVPQPHGGALLDGMAKNHVPGPGRPKDALRQKLLALADGQGIPFLKQLYKGEIHVRFVGTCFKCKHEQVIPEGPFLDKLLDRAETAVRDSVDHRLRGNDQALKYGLGTKDEIDVASHPDAIKFAEAYRDALAQEGADTFNRVMQRVADTLGRTT